MRIRVVTLNDLGDDVRASMHGARWLLLQAQDIEDSTPLLMFTELDDILVAVDHRGSTPLPGLWQRAVHLILSLMERKNKPLSSSANQGLRK